MGKLEHIDAEFPPAAAARVAGKLLNLHSPHEIAEAITILMDVLDLLGGDPEAEEMGAEDSFEDHGGCGPGCPISDSADDQAWREWDNLAGAVKRAGGHGGTFIEDDEDDDPDRAHDEGEPDYGRQAGEHDGPGCEISDTGGDEHDGGEPENDAETLQMEDDVPMLPVVSAAYNIFTDQREPLGISNLQSSFVCQRDVRSADSGNMLAPSQRSERKPGAPV